VEGTESRSRATLIALLLALGFGVWGAAGVSLEHSWGWDEAWNVQYPAARMALRLERGELGEVGRVAVQCQQYPFVWPAVLGAVQTVTGISETVARRSGRLLWGVGLLGLFLLARRLTLRLAEARGSPARGDPLVPWIAMGLGACCPMALSFSGTLFLETPFAVASIFALHAWLGRGRGQSGWREVAAGGWITVAFFTKFNYGLLLAFGLGLAYLIEVALEVRAGRGRDVLRRSLLLGAVPVVVCAWWFLWPWPGGSSVAESHRSALIGFLGGNRDASMRTSLMQRVMDWGTYLVLSPRWWVLLAAGLVATPPLLRLAPARVVWIVLLASTLPVALHPFHLDRFLLPGAVPLWILTALGLARLLPVSSRGRVATGVVALPLLFLGPQWDSGWLAGQFGLLKEETREEVSQALRSRRDLTADRRLGTNGLTRAQHDALLDLLAPTLAPEERIGWVGMSQAFSPAALHLGLIARGQPPRAAFLEGRLDRSFVTIANVDPGWDDPRLAAWASGFDVILATRPVDLTANPAREFLGDFQVRLLESGRWKATELGALDIVRRAGQENVVRVFALRPSR